MPCLLLTLQVQPHAMAAQARAAADQAEAHLDAMAVRAVAQRASAEDSTLQAAQRTEPSAVCRAIAELWQMEARWHHLGLPKELAATELMTELKDDPPLMPRLNAMHLWNSWLKLAAALNYGSVSRRAVPCQLPASLKAPGAPSQTGAHIMLCAQEPSVGTQDGLPTSKPRIYSFNSQVEADRLHAAHAQNRGGERPSETDQYTRPRQVQ